MFTTTLQIDVFRGHHRRGQVLRPPVRPRLVAFPERHTLRRVHAEPAAAGESGGSAEAASAQFGLADFAGK